jgi:hypothetical protein
LNAPVRAIEFHSPVGSALSLFSKASSLFARKEFPVMPHKGIYRQLPDIASYSFIGFISEGPKATKFPVLFPVSREFE